MRRIRILLVDDIREMLDLIEQVLAADTTLEVVGSCRSGKDFLARARKLTPDVAIVDVSLGEESGFELARQLSKAGSAVKVIFLSVHEDAEFVDAGFQAGGKGYVFKSRIGTDLVAAIKAVSQSQSFTSSALCI